MKNIQQLLFIILFTVLLILTLDCNADTIVWSGNIELNNDQQFTQQQTLKVMPGTVVTATGSFKIEIRGNIIAEGTNARFAHCRFEYGKANIPGSWFEDQGQTDYLSGNQGGALWIFDYNNIELNNCTFYYNYARSRGGGIYYQDIDSISIIDCVFENNKVLVYGGGLFCGGQQYLIVDKCMFKLNSAWLETIGGGIFSHGSAIYLDYPANPFNLITNNYFFNNKSLATVAIFTSASFVCNNIFTNNYNKRVLTFNCDESSHLVVNNIFANNFYESGIPGVFNFSQDLRFYNNILWNNFSDEYNDDDMAL